MWSRKVIGSLVSFILDPLRGIEEKAQLGKVHALVAKSHKELQHPLNNMKFRYSIRLKGSLTFSRGSFQELVEWNGEVQPRF